jgi:phospholipase/lecithinase/hemolysin
MKTKSLIAGAFVVAVISGQSQSTNTASPYSALYAFGFSWTDTRDTICGWGPPQYYHHQACNGTMWPEFVSTNLGLAYIAANNLTRCGAASAGILNQVKQLNLGTNAALGLYFLSAAESDFLYGASTGSLPTRTIPYIPWTNDVAWNQLIQTAVNNYSNAVAELYARGARSIVAQNNFDVSMSPFLISEFGTNQGRTLKFRERIRSFNLALRVALGAISDAKPDLRLLTVDTEAKLNDLLTNAAAYGFTKTFPAALDDARLGDKSFTGPGKDYVFWDSLHPTSKTQTFIAAWLFQAVTNAVLEKLEASIVSNSLNLKMNKLRIGRNYTLQSSGDLSNWQDIQMFTAAAGTNQWPTASIGSGPHFYRLAWQP